MALPCRFAALLGAGLVASAAALAQADEGARLISDLARRQRLARDFEHQLAVLGWPARLDCQTMVEIPGPGRAGSVGALCRLQGPPPARLVMLCDDFSVGKLTVKAWGYSASEASLITFTRDNCPSGG